MNDHIRVMCVLLALIGLCLAGIVAAYWPRPRRQAQKEADRCSD